MDNIRPDIQELCDRLHANDGDFQELYLYPLPRNQTEIEALIEALGANTHVRDMDITSFSSSPENHALAKFVAETLIPSHPSLESLGLSVRIADDLWERIAGALKANRQLKRLRLSSNKLSSNGLQALATGISNNSGLQDIAIVFNGLGVDGCRTIVSAISKKPNFNLIQRLKLNNNNIGPEGGRVIANFIPGAKSLKALVIHNNKLGNKGCKFIASALPKSLSLEVLDMLGNNITDRGCRYFASALRNSSSLRGLSLGHNRITNKGAMALQESLQHINYSICYLNIGGNIGVSEKERSIIRLCNDNYRLKNSFENINIPGIPLCLWPKVLEYFVTKPDYIFGLIKTQPLLYRERSSRVQSFANGSNQNQQNVLINNTHQPVLFCDRRA